MGAHPHPEAAVEPFCFHGAVFSTDKLPSHARLRCSAAGDAALIFDWHVPSRRLARRVHRHRR